ncbi:hypothetical protein BOX15_Mlig005079g1 [Macrostomum lignano]|uniref:EGF-like domain-containing protein n=1 Tax=Macrostomum lignano TaxID=282301 RepID=A0A267FAY8_9PLAT|nr:hypothetical protein BOX15_Mlig005079g1 [Macrostomum lignano]
MRALQLIGIAGSLHVLSSFAIAPTQAADCSTVTCYNGGTCNNYTVSPACLCPLPYIAPYCESAADYCFTLQPDKNITELPVCQNGGTCTLTYTDPYFNCSCPTGYTGIRCSDKVLNAESNERTYCLYDCDSGLTTTSKVVIGVCAPVLFIVLCSFFLYICATGRTEKATDPTEEPNAKSHSCECRACCRCCWRCCS